MATKIVTKNSSTASAVPTASDLVQGELAVNVADKRLFTEDNAGAIVELGTNPYNFTANHDGSAKLATTSTGIDVTGTAVADSYDIGSLGTLGSVATDRLFIATADGLGLQFDFDNSRIVPVGADGSTYNNNVSLGSSGLEFKNLLLSGNATVGGTATMGGLVTNTAGTSNFVAGVNAGNSIVSGGNYNTVVGDEAGTAITTGGNNTALGYTSLISNTTGGQNVALGLQTLYYNTTASNNTAVGHVAMTFNTTGTSNVAVGGDSLYSNTTASNNTAVGYKSLYANTTGTGNSSLGKGALQNNTTASYNTGLGENALLTNTTGASNTAVGNSALYANTTASNNTAVGVSALTANTTGDRNVAVGTSALDANTTADGNTAVGYDALSANTTAEINTGLGFQALRLNTTGASNTSVGANALGSNTTANNNTAVGSSALLANTTGTDNVAIGFEAGKSSTTANSNTFVGRKSGTNATGGSNTFLGEGAGFSMTSGTDNTFVGQDAGSQVTGQKNTLLGCFNGNQGGLDIRTTSNNIVLSDGDGNPRGFYHGGLSSPSWFFNTPTQNQWAMNVQNTHGSSPYGLNVQFTGAIPNNTTNKFITCQDGNAQRLVIFSNGNVVNVNNSYGAISDVKLKENIIDASSQWEDIKALTVRKYSMKTDNLDAPNMLGVIAQEVEAAGMGGLVYESLDLDSDMTDLGTVTKQVNYSILYMKAVKALQEAMTRIESLEERITTLEG